MLLHVLACTAYNHPAARPSRLSSPQRAAAELGLHEHHAPPMPDWIAASRTIWVETVDGTCSAFDGNKGFYSHEVCSLRRDNGETVTDWVTVDLELDPSEEGGASLSFWVRPYRSVAPEGEIGAMIGAPSSARRGPWYAVAATADEVRFESIVYAWYRPVWVGRACTRASSRALADVDPESLRARYHVVDGRKFCVAEGEPLAIRPAPAGVVADYFPDERLAPGRVDCREPCPPFGGARMPGDVYVGPDALPDPMYRDPDPDVVVIYRTETACMGSPVAGRFEMPPAECDSP